LDFDKSVELLNEMAAEAAALIASAGVLEDQVSQHFSVMMRYLGQGYEIEVPLTLEMIEAHDRDALLANFSEAYRHRYGRSEDMPAELLSWRLAVTGPQSTLGDTLGRRASDAEGTTVATKKRPVWFGDGFVETPVYKRTDFDTESKIQGPAIIEETESTLILPAEFQLSVDASLNLILETTG
jgi:N-methylhydantoinase A